MRSCWSLRSNEIVAFILLILSWPSAIAQFSLNKPDSVIGSAARKSEPYLFPVHPGTTATLTGTMGELRSTHFHAGLDIDTPATGVPVLSAQNGYISRAIITTGGYGNVLFIAHPDGNTTVYAHLDQFKGPVAEFIRKERYARKVSEIDLFFKPSQFPIKKGEEIALSGNTGGSGGPHLHFEVRNRNNEAVNPLQYQFSEIKDSMAPIAHKIALKTLDANSRINDQFGRFEFSLIRKGDNYVFNQPILANGRIAIEILANDKMENSRFRFGIPYIEMRVDSQVVFTQNIDRINFNETRNILALMDFKTLELRGSRFNKLYVDDGNRLAYYNKTQHKQAIEVKDKDVRISIKLKDYNGNTSTIRFLLKTNPVVKQTPFVGTMTIPYIYDIQENTLKINVKNCPQQKDNTITLWEQGKKSTANVNYSGTSQSIYLINLKSRLPDSIQTCQGTLRLNLKDKIPSETAYKFYSDRVEMSFPHQSLYDTAYLSVAWDTIKTSELFTLGTRTIPLHKSVSVTIRPQLSYTPSRNLGLYRMEGNDRAFVYSEWQNDKVKFSTRELGQFTFMRDTIPPTVTAMSVTNTSARLKIKDELSGISYFEASIDGQWLLMTYDYKTGMMYSERLDEKKLLKGDFELKVVDNAGNKTIYKQKIL
jgi:Peptidase family M23